MGTAVIGFEQDTIAAFQQGVDRVDDFNTHLFHLFRIGRDSTGAGFNVWAAFRVSTNHFAIGDVFRGIRSIQNLGECDAMARVQTNDPNLDDVFRLLSGHRMLEEAEPSDEQE